MNKLRLELVESDSAIADLELVLLHLMAHSTLKSASSFLSAVHIAYGRLAMHPEMGSKREFKIPEFANLRILYMRYPIRFYLIFYQVIGSQLIIRRLLHGPRDIKRIMAESDKTS